MKREEGGMRTGTENKGEAKLGSETLLWTSEDAGFLGTDTCRSLSIGSYIL